MTLSLFIPMSVYSFCVFMFRSTQRSCLLLHLTNYVLREFQEPDTELPLSNMTSVFVFLHIFHTFVPNGQCVLHQRKKDFKWQWTWIFQLDFYCNSRKVDEHRVIVASLNYKVAQIQDINDDITKLLLHLFSTALRYTQQVIFEVSVQSMKESSSLTWVLFLLFSIGLDGMYSKRMRSEMSWQQSQMGQEIWVVRL